MDYLRWAQTFCGSAWSPLQRLVDIAQLQPVSLYLVGGSVRDALLQVAGRDIDIAVEGDAVALATAAAQRLGGSIETNSDFGTATWITATGEVIDLASTRTETYKTPGALPHVSPADLRHDLPRRDFSINAMAIALHAPRAGALIDPTGGLADLHAGQLRVLHPVSFADDPTRAFRAARFAGRFGFALEASTRRQLLAARRQSVMEAVTLERWHAELNLILSEPRVVPIMRVMRTLRLLTPLHPRLAAGRVFMTQLRRAQKAWAALGKARLPQAHVLWIVLAATLPAAERAALARLFGHSRELRPRWQSGPERVAAALAALSGGDQVAWSRALASLELAERICVWALAPSAAARQQLLWWENAGQAIRSAVTGNTLRQLGYAEGPGFKVALEAALDAARCGADATAQLAVAQRALK